MSDCSTGPSSSLTPASVAAAYRPHLSITAMLVAINTAVFLLMVWNRVPIWQPHTDQLVRWGANFGPYSLDRQWWRLLTAFFVHIGLAHLLLNMWCLWELGNLAELLYGGRAFLGLYLLGGLAGSIASLARNPMVVGAGASGAIFAVAGALIATFYLGQLPIPAHVKRVSLASLLVFAGYNLAYGFLKGGIDNGAHIGGLVCGLLLGAALSRDFPHGERVPAAWRRWVFPAMTLLLIVAALIVRQVNRPVALLGKAEKLLQEGKTAAAIADLNRIAQRKPGYAIFVLLGNAYSHNKQDAAAEAAYLRAVQLRPSETSARKELGVLYWKKQQLEEARAAFAKVTELNPKDGDAWYSLGMLLRQMDRQPEAAAALQKAAAGEPNVVPAQFNLGLTLMGLKRYDEAIAAFQNVVRLRPNDPDAYIWLANAYAAKGMDREADAAFAQAYSLRAKKTRKR